MKNYALFLVPAVVGQIEFWTESMGNANVLHTHFTIIICLFDPRVSGHFLIRRKNAISHLTSMAICGAEVGAEEIGDSKFGASQTGVMAGKIGGPIGGQGKTPRVEGVAGVDR